MTNKLRSPGARLLDLLRGVKANNDQVILQHHESLVAQGASPTAQAILRKRTT